MLVSGLPSVDGYRSLVEACLDGFQGPEQPNSFKSPLSEDDCDILVESLALKKKEGPSDEGQQVHYAAIETVFREKFYDLLASADIHESSFHQVWNLLDVVAILSDKELCQSELVFWLIEELLDSQTIDGCRKVFDYLESRRERITSKHFKQKQLIILRCCNELLRRLSRAEDIVFCGRVFIFLFQSFPLGDKSSVNLRGEFHVENMTTYDLAPKKSEDAIRPMDLDAKIGVSEISNAASPAVSGAGATEDQNPVKPSLSSNGPSDAGNEPDLDTLYPLFWSLQSYFSAPTRLFDSQNLSSFKEGIAATMTCFQKVGVNAAPSRRHDDIKRGTKRKRSESGNEVASTFNPKYLTNRDLFDLEVHDIAFRRHVLVQALILLDFLLSLTPTAKAKLADLTNKSVLYGFTLTDEDAAWAIATKASIASYLQQGNSNEGKFYYRMVDTVLSRDKNWVRWKAENCPPIDRAPNEVQQHLDAQRSLQEFCTTQPLPPPPGASDLDFLSRRTGMESLKERWRYTVPSMESFYQGIQNDELDAELGTAEEMEAAQDAKERKIWRALRASRTRFNLCEKIENGKNLRALVGEDVEAKETEVENMEPTEAGQEDPTTTDD